MTRLWKRHQEPSAESLAFRAIFDHFNLGDSPVGFGPDTCWLAVRCERPKLVAENLDAAVGASRWKTGMHLAGDDERLFITPVVDGWVLVVAVEATDDNLLRLSTTIGQTLAFDTRPTSLGWARATDREVERGRSSSADDVLALAARWSVDPRSIEGRPELEGPGWLGRLVRLRSSASPRPQRRDA